jgi:hypothetical protein
MSEERMRMKFGVFRRRGESLDYLNKLLAVDLEINGLRSAYLLVHFGPRLEPGRPRYRDVKRAPFHHRAGEKIVGPRIRFLAQLGFE